METVVAGGHFLSLDQPERLATLIKWPSTLIKSFTVPRLRKRRSWAQIIACRISQNAPGSIESFAFESSTDYR
jgi:hypothetical protein